MKQEEIEKAAKKFSFHKTGNHSGQIAMSYPVYTNDITEAFGAGALWHAEQSKNEAIRLADAILKSDYRHDGNECWRAYRGTGSHQFTTAELYEIFQTQTNKSK